jgi:predicted aminopeptidase
MEIILAWVSAGLGVCGLAYCIYQIRLKASIERLATLQAWDVYQSAYQALGWFNDAIGETAAHKKEIILAQAHARVDSHYSKTIHNIYTHHEKVSLDLIDKWVSESRIKEHAKSDFLKHNGENSE